MKGAAIGICPGSRESVLKEISLVEHTGLKGVRSHRMGNAVIVDPFDRRTLFDGQVGWPERERLDGDQLWSHGGSWCHLGGLGSWFGHGLGCHRSLFYGGWGGDTVYRLSLG